MTIHPSLSMKQGLALSSEVQSAQNLMRDAVAAIRGLREPTTHADAVFTLGSIGVEKVAKLMLGCSALAIDGRWPTIAEMKGWGHDIETLSREVGARARSGVGAASAKGYAGQLLERIESSTSLPLLFATLSRYGRSGRFHYLDVLATDEEPDWDAPGEYWTRLENHVVESSAELREMPRTSSEDFNRFLQALSSTIAHELETWWFAMHRLGVQGCFGDAGKKIGWQLWPIGRADPLRQSS